MPSTGSCCQYFRIYAHDYSSLAVSTLAAYKEMGMPYETGMFGYFCINNYKQAYAASNAGNKQTWNNIVVQLYCDDALYAN